MVEVEKSNSELKYERIKKKAKINEIFAILLTISSFAAITILAFLDYLFTL